MKVRTAAVVAVAVVAVVVAAALILGRTQGDAPSTRAEVTASDAATPHQDASSGGKEAAVRTPTPFALPRSSPPPALVSAPLPKTANASGAIVRGFPSKVISLAPRSSVTFTSVASDSTRLRAGLEATSTLSPVNVLDYYRTAFARLGLVASSAPAVGGSSAVAFVRAASTVTVTATPDTGGGSRYSVHAVLVVER